MKRKPATKAESARLAAVKRLPCIACLHMGCEPQCGPTTGHHLLSGGKRRGHMFVIPLGTWHHQGYPLGNWTPEKMTEWFGPSLANGSKPFHAAFGSDDELLAETNRMLERREVA